MNSFGGRLGRLLKRFARSRKGNVAMMAGIALPVLLMISAGAIDLHHAAKVKSELQDALDAATLAAARSNYTAASDIQRVGMASLKANMPNYFKDGGGDVASFTLPSRYQVQATATVQVKTIIANVFLPPYGKLFDDYLPMSASSDVLRASRNVEVAMALDITGSMASYMKDLKDAAKELVGIVVQGDQQVFQTRVALIPYAAGVNAGTYAEAMRGVLLEKTNITNVAWHQGAKVLTGAATTGFTAPNGHGLSPGDYVYLTGFATNPTSGNSLQNKIFRVNSVNGNVFTINESLTSRNIVANGTRTFYRCYDSQCNVAVTSPNHGLSTNDYATITGVSGITALNNNTYKVTRLTDSMFTVPVARPSGTFSGSNGRVECHYDGCKVRKFDSQDGVMRTLASSTCVTERPYASGRSVPSDVAPSSGSRTNLVGRMYPEISSSNANPCPTPVITPLTNDITSSNNLNKIIDDYSSGGSTAGQIGIEQAWYAISPTFGSIFPKDSRPNEFDSSKTVKAVILMTDGEFNTPYCQGVISQDAVDNGNAGNKDYQINCGSTNGSVFEQSVRVCDAMKAQGIVVYTVGFNLKTAPLNSVTDTAYEVMYRCATDPREHFFATTSGRDMKEAFKQIGRDITRLRIAR